MDYQYSEITPEVIELAKLCTQKVVLTQVYMQNMR